MDLSDDTLDALGKIGLAAEANCITFFKDINREEIYGASEGPEWQSAFNDGLLRGLSIFLKLQGHTDNQADDIDRVVRPELV
jgi:hypothetical protein